MAKNEKKRLKHIRSEGHSKVIAVTDIIPSGWDYVRPYVVTEKPDSITIKFERVK